MFKSGSTDLTSQVLVQDVLLNQEEEAVIATVLICG